MKTNPHLKVLATGLFLSITLFTTGSLRAQTFTTLHNFSGVSDGSSPSGMVLSGTTLYGTTALGGSTTNGTVFTVQTDGTGFTNLHNFNDTTDGSQPWSGVILSGNTLYGTTYGNGSVGLGSGTVFKINTDGTGFTVLHTFESGDSATFTNAGGAFPFGGLVLSGSTLYGTTENGGTSASGTVFSVQTDGTGFMNLHNFNGSSDGGRPVAGLVLSGNTLYGTARFRAFSNMGTLYKVNIDGSGFTVMHTFMGGSDGGQPLARMILSGSTLYGTTTAGAYPKDGTIFKIDINDINGSTFAVLYGFDPNVDGKDPFDALLLSGNTLYGTAYYGGSGGWGSVFSLSTDGTGFVNLHNFTHGSDGSYPIASVILSGNTLYGAAQAGSTVWGQVFSLELGCAPAVMNIAQYAGVSVSGSPGCTYRVDYTTNLTAPVLWTPLTTNTLSSSPYLYVDTNVLSGMRFYQTVLVP